MTFPRPDDLPSPERTPLVDAGVNLLDRSFDRDREHVLRRARQAGVEGLVAIASDLDESDATLAYARGDEAQASGLWFAVTLGIHPHRAGDAPADFAARLGASLRAAGSPTARPAAGGPPAVVLGECGLDYNRDYSPRDAQRRVFAAQVELACELGVALYVHDRDAHADCAAILADAGDRLPPTLVHCFTGTAQALARWIELGVHVGVTGWICDERRGGGLRDLVGEIPADRLVLETDAPYLLPRTIRPRPDTRRNEPRALPWVLAQVAASRGEAPEEVARRTTANARRLFGIAPSA